MTMLTTVKAAAKVPQTITPRLLPQTVTVTVKQLHLVLALARPLKAPKQPLTTITATLVLDRMRMQEAGHRTRMQEAGRPMIIPIQDQAIPTLPTPTPTRVQDRRRAALDQVHQTIILARDQQIAQIREVQATFLRVILDLDLLAIRMTVGLEMMRTVKKMMTRLQPLHLAQPKEMTRKIAKRMTKAQIPAITDPPKTLQIPKHLHHPLLAAQHQLDQSLLQDKITAELPLGMNKRAMLETVELLRKILTRSLRCTLVITMEAVTVGRKSN